LTASLATDPAGTTTVGTMIRWTAQGDGGSADLWYRFRLRDAAGNFRVIRDFGPANTLDWTSLDEGSPEIEVTIQDRTLQATATAVASVDLTSRVSDTPTVFPTSHPLVMLFSTPGCEAGRARVRFEGHGVVQFTSFKPCDPGHSLNFYVGGLAPNTNYTAGLVFEQGRNVFTRPTVEFTTGDASYVISLPVVLQPPATTSQSVLLQAPVFLPAVATDLAGTLLWYGPPGLTYLTRPEPGGTFLGIGESRTDRAQDVLRRIDLVGMTVQETNAARVSDQLVEMGKRPITGFHHEARPISGGRLAVLGSVEQLLTNVQGPGTVDVLGDMILVLDADMQVLWAWDTFDHLDVTRKAILSETCLASPGCPPYYLALDANDWTHGNALAETPDGALLYSARHQDWLLKIDYRKGMGDGTILWRLGKDGDFTFDSADPFPWFSHQHDASFEPGSASNLTVFDNGNTRMVSDPAGNSRGQVLFLDETNRIVRHILNADLGVQSMALGSAQRLNDGNYHFDAGYVADASGPAGRVGYSMEVDPAGAVVGSLQLKALVYRSFRLTDLYGSPEAPAPEAPTTVQLPFRGAAAAVKP